MEARLPEIEVSFSRNNKRAYVPDSKINVNSNTRNHYKTRNGLTALEAYVYDLILELSEKLPDDNKNELMKNHTPLNYKRKISLARTHFSRECTWRDF